AAGSRTSTKSSVAGSPATWDTLTSKVVQAVQGPEVPPGERAAWFSGDAIALPSVLSPGPRPLPSPIVKLWIRSVARGLPAHIGGARAALTYRDVRRWNRPAAGTGRSYEDVIDEAPPPVLPRLVGAHHGMTRLPVVPGRVPVRRGVAAADVTAAETQAQLDRVRAVPHTLGTRPADRGRFRVRQRGDVRALFHDGQITTGTRNTAWDTGGGPTWT